MKQTQLTAQPRQRQTKGENGRLRKSGKIPAILYGGDGQPMMLCLNERELEMDLHGSFRSSHLYELDVEGAGEKALAVIRDIARHPVTDRLQHIDFLRVKAGQAFEMEVALRVIGGTPAGVREGGILEHSQRTVTIRCLPRQIPEAIDVDLSGLKVHESIHVSDLVLPEGVEVLDAPEMTLFTVVAPKVQEEAAAAEGAVQPEVIGQKKPEAES
jgi:large subunit ribosomal protein L25